MIYKLKAFAVHIGISLAIFIAIISYIIYFWYPQPFFVSDGGWQGIRIIAAVDLILGPVLTLIVYKPKKPKLKLDLTIIGLVQASALVWGIWVVHFERPIATVYAEGFFFSVTANDMKRTGIAPGKLNTFGERSPFWIYSKLPSDLNELQKIRISALQSGRTVHLMADYYVALDQSVRDQLVAESFNIEVWIKDKPEGQVVYQKFKEKHKSEMEDIIIFPWRARYARSFVALRKSDLKFIAMLDIRPPEVEKEKPEYRQSN